LVWLQGRPRVPFAAISLGHGTPTFGRASFGLVLRHRNDRSHLSSGRYITGPFSSAGKPPGRPRSAGWDESGRILLRQGPVDGTARRSGASAPRSTGPGFGQGQGKHRAGRNPRLRARAETCAPRRTIPGSSDPGGRRRTAPSESGAFGHLRKRTRPVRADISAFGRWKKPEHSCWKKPASSDKGGNQRNPHQPNQHTRAGRRRPLREMEETRATPCRRNHMPSGRWENRRNRDGGHQHLRALEETNATVRSETRVLGQRRKRTHRAGGNQGLRAQAETDATR
jgi:hypothetical protein